MNYEEINRYFQKRRRNIVRVIKRPGRSYWYIKWKGDDGRQNERSTGLKAIDENLPEAELIAERIQEELKND